MPCRSSRKSLQPWTVRISFARSPKLWAGSCISWSPFSSMSMLRVSSLLCASRLSQVFSRRLASWTARSLSKFSQCVFLLYANTYID